MVRYTGVAKFTTVTELHEFDVMWIDTITHMTWLLFSVYNFVRMRANS